MEDVWSSINEPTKKENQAVEGTYLRSDVQSIKQAAEITLN